MSRLEVISAVNDQICIKAVRDETRRECSAPSCRKGLQASSSMV